MTALPLDYGAIKKNFQSNVSMNPFFGRYNHLSQKPTRIDQYIGFYNLVDQTIYNHPLTTVDHCTFRAPYFVSKSSETQITLPTMISEYMPESLSYFDINTVDGLMLVATGSRSMSMEELCVEMYKLMTKGKSPALRSVESDDRQVHWVWFRRTPTWRLTNEIVLRAASWIELNPGYTFHLWTNLKDGEELCDFLADLRADIRERYFASNCIKVHYNDEFLDVMIGWLNTNVNQETKNTFVTVWNSKERQDIVMKTDYSRNILLAVFGGIYSDFNDLVCIAPIEPMVECHAGNYVGVTDNSNVSNTSNYFMYAGKDNEAWVEIVKKCTETLPVIYNTIHNKSTFESVCEILLTIINEGTYDLSKIQTLLDDSPLKSFQIMPKHFLYTICMAIEFGISSSSPDISRQINAFLRPNTHNRMKHTFNNEVVVMLRSMKDTIQSMLGGDELRHQFELAWRFSQTDMYLNTIMHRSNLPIFCREQSIPIYNLQYGYLLRYSCVLSFVGHLGDGSSYGMNSIRNINIEDFCVRS